MSNLFEIPQHIAFALSLAAQLGAGTPDQEHRSREIAQRPVAASSALTETGRAQTEQGIVRDAFLRQAAPDLRRLGTMASRAPGGRSTGVFMFSSPLWFELMARHGARFGHGELAEAIIKDSKGRYRVPDAAKRAQILKLRTDPKFASLIAVLSARGNGRYLERKLNRPVGAADMYFARTLGLFRAVRFLKAVTETPAVTVDKKFGALVRRHPTLFMPNGAPITLGRSYSRVAAFFAAGKFREKGIQAVALAHLPRRAVVARKSHAERPLLPAETQPTARADRHETAQAATPTVVTQIGAATLAAPVLPVPAQRVRAASNVAVPTPKSAATTVTDTTAVADAVDQSPVVQLPVAQSVVARAVVAELSATSPADSGIAPTQAVAVQATAHMTLNAATTGGAPDGTLVDGTIVALSAEVDSQAVLSSGFAATSATSMPALGVLVDYRLPLPVRMPVRGRQPAGTISTGADTVARQTAQRAGVPPLPVQAAKAAMVAGVLGTTASGSGTATGSGAGAALNDLRADLAKLSGLPAARGGCASTLGVVCSDPVRTAAVDVTGSNTGTPGSILSRLPSLRATVSAPAAQPRKPRPHRIQVVKLGSEGFGDYDLAEPGIPMRGPARSMNVKPGAWDTSMIRPVHHARRRAAKFHAAAADTGVREDAPLAPRVAAAPVVLDAASFASVAAGASATGLRPAPRVSYVPPLVAPAGYLDDELRADKALDEATDSARAEGDEPLDNAYATPRRKASSRGTTAAPKKLQAKRKPRSRLFSEVERWSWMLFGSDR